MEMTNIALWQILQYIWHWIGQRIRMLRIWKWLLCQCATGGWTSMVFCSWHTLNSQEIPFSENCFNNKWSGLLPPINHQVTRIYFKPQQEKVFAYTLWCDKIHDVSWPINVHLSDRISDKTFSSGSLNTFFLLSRRSNKILATWTRQKPTSHSSNGTTISSRASSVSSIKWSHEIEYQL